jgi:SAM-dependent methyltransferase
MVTRESTRRGYDRVAAQYANELAGELEGKPLDRALLTSFAELARAEQAPVADIGCGPGHVGGFLAGLGLPVIGLDLSPAMCATGSAVTGLKFAAADMTALPLVSASLGGIVCFYAVIHLSPLDREAAYREFARVLHAGSQLLLAFHVRDADNRAGASREVGEFFGEQVELEFYYLDPDDELGRLRAAGFRTVARLDRAPVPGVEHPSERCYLLLQHD